MGVILAATDALNWYGALVGQSAEILTQELDALQAPSKTAFLPYLGGERTPLNSASVRGAFVGLEHATDRAAGTRAVLEGVTYALLDCKNALLATGTKLDSLIAVGGGTNSAYWLAAIATALDISIKIPVAGNFGAAFGAARLAIMAAHDLGAEIATEPPISTVIDPVRSLSQAFDAGYDRFRDLQSAMLTY
jgi:xylulokinase